MKILIEAIRAAIRISAPAALKRLKQADEATAARVWRRPFDSLFTLFNKPTDSPAHRSIQRHLVVGVTLLAAVGFGVGGWAATTRLSGAVITSGYLVVDTNLKKVQHPTGGVISELNVREGDHVEEGQILLRLDKTQSLAQLMVVAKSLDELLARQARLEAERDNAKEIVVPNALLFRARDSSDDAAKAIVGEQNLFEMRREAETGKKSQLQQRITQAQEEIKGLLGQIEANNQETELIKRELQGVTDLLHKGLVPLSKATALERDKARLDGERSQLMGSVAQIRGKIAETEIQILQIDWDRQSENAKDLSDVRGKIIELVEKKTAAEEQFKRTDIRAPQEGVVHHLSVHTIGGVIGQGETIMEIVPGSDSLKAEVKIAPEDIDKVWRGQPVVLRFSSFNARTTPEIDGKVSFVSADLSVDQRTGISYYTADIIPNPDELPRLGEVKLVPGMPVEAFVRTGERTVLSYLMKPLGDQIARGFKEK